VSTVVSVREYAKLTTAAVESSLDCAHVSGSAFDYLCHLSESFSRTGARLVQVEGRQSLTLDNYVGVVQTPCGTTLEIVPKHHQVGDDLMKCRALLRKMIQATLDLPTREVDEAALERFDAPLSEWVMRRFLAELDHLIKRGIRFDYHRVAEELPFLRGQLNLMRQLRQPPGREHRFHVRHDVYLPDRAENRLLKLALDHVRLATKDADNWRLAQELSFLLAEVPASDNVRDDFRAWGTDRLMAHYRPAKPWCDLILSRRIPLAVVGDQAGLSLLFPMEKLFERYVAAWLRRQVKTDTWIRTPAASESLCTHLGGRIFQLEPDVLLGAGERRWVLDMKWKRIDASDVQAKYNISQADFYQMFAYGHKYMHGKGTMALIYPMSASFFRALEPFHFSPALQVQVLPFDLDNDNLLGWQVVELPLRCEMKAGFASH
jgi:5-methylcytosine-specific restriction enzyme subunit McrC